MKPTVYCKKCGWRMTHIYSFEPGAANEYYRCAMCRYESKKKPIVFVTANVVQKSSPQESLGKKRF